MGINNSDVTEVHYDGLDQMATEIATQARNLEASLEVIKGEVQKVSGMWEGEAHQAYIRKQAEWDKEARAIHEALHAIGRAVHAAGGDYMGGDKKAASYFQ
ncbi:WXG100 family type VII secretion target [Streptomyces sp. NPDC004232]|uniref:WXG100 family type VII secretion target n=1 Tax=unclassified Streptomyces TaxID=2593676 RepID=UPI001E108EB8|nr:WXG100 family type VII secretion target [Streptomyces sp. tea 10]